MTYKITITENQDTSTATAIAAPAQPVVRFQQTLDAIDIKKIINAVNSKPRNRRVGKEAKAQKTLV